MKKIIYRNWNKVKVVVLILTALLFDASYIGYKVIKGYYGEWVVMKDSLEGLGGQSTEYLIGSDLSENRKWWIKNHGIKLYLDADGWAYKELAIPVVDIDHSWVRLELKQRFYDSRKRKVVSHEYGIDIRSIYKLGLIASQSGVIEIGKHFWYGNYVIIDNKKGLRVLYAHLNKVYFKAGEKVEKYQVIGTMGETGYTFGVHCHYEIWDHGKNVNPLSMTTYDQEVQ